MNWVWIHINTKHWITEGREYLSLLASDWFRQACQPMRAFGGGPETAEGFLNLFHTVEYKEPQYLWKRIRATMKVLFEFWQLWKSQNDEKKV